jgi:hypothetical protein
LPPTLRLGDVADLKLVCPEPLPIEKLKLKITTKSQIEILLPELKLIRITDAHCYSFCLPYSQTACCTHTLSVWVAVLRNICGQIVANMKFVRKFVRVR